MAASAEWNFAAQLVTRLGPHSFLIDAATGEAIRSGELTRRIIQTGAFLRSAGLKKGDRVLIGCSLSPACVLVYLGAMYAGLVAVPVEHRVLSSLATELLEKTDAKAIWTETGLPQEINQELILNLRGDLAAEFQQSPPAMTAAACEPSDLAALMATSGSTGIPRFVMVSHANLIANTEAITRSQRLSNYERAILILPLSYCFGASVLHTHLYQGGGVVLDRRFMFPNKVLRAMVEHQCTTFAGVPTAYNVLLRRSDIRQIDMPHLRRFLQAGGPLGRERIREMLAIFPNKEFYVMYGQTEATARISCLDPEQLLQKSGSVGKPLDNLEVRIVDDNGNDLPSGQVGELLVRGPSICQGYLGDPEETRAVFYGGWLRTRDLARLDKDGYLWIEGRKGSFLKIRGIRVSLAEVTARVTAIPGIYECAARAVNHPEAGEALVLFIVPEPGAEIEAEQVRRHIPPHWALDSVHLVSELPKTSSGKIALTSLPV